MRQWFFYVSPAFEKKGSGPERTPLFPACDAEMLRKKTENGAERR